MQPIPEAAEPQTAEPESASLTRPQPEEQPLPRIGPWQEDLDKLLTANEGKASRERLTLIRIFEDLRGR